MKTLYKTPPYQDEGNHGLVVRELDREAIA